MGKPATTYWCENGHLLEDNSSHCYGERDLRDERNYFASYEGGALPPEKHPPCPRCGSEKAVMMCNWRDNEYLQLVPTDPITFEVVEIPCPCGKGTYNVEIPVYDVSALLDEEKRNKLRFVWMEEHFPKRVDSDQ